MRNTQIYLELQQNIVFHSVWTSRVPCKMYYRQHVSSLARQHRVGENLLHLYRGGFINVIIFLLRYTEQNNAVQNN